MIDYSNIKLRIHPTEHMKQLLAYKPVKPNEHTDIEDAIMYAYLTMNALIEKGEVDEQEK